MQRPSPGYRKEGYGRERDKRKVDEVGQSFVEIVRGQKDSGSKSDKGGGDTSLSMFWESAQVEKGLTQVEKGLTKKMGIKVRKVLNKQRKKDDSDRAFVVKGVFEKGKQKWERPVEVYSSGKQKSNKETFLASSLRVSNVNRVKSNEGEAFLSSSDEELVQDSVEVKRNFVLFMPKNLLMNSDSLEEEEGLEHDRRMDFSSQVDVSEVEEVENCAGSVTGDGEDEVVVVNSAGRIAGDSEEELVRATIAVERKPGKSKVKVGNEAIHSKHVSSKIRKCKHRLKIRNSKCLGV
ncbi:hypothetical protein LWI29_000350 [Acer saccharum]|uniref:Uncharacterized protein n=1 Tax=Acer saccharum TaxID=4024 RepID=A0AA39TC52_ACESA|nr:hypothetical protein LWI29_000350 [Acer saccharum]